MKSKKHPVLNLNPLHRAYEEEKAFDFESESPSSSLWRGKSIRFWIRILFIGLMKSKQHPILNLNPLHWAYEEEKASGFESESPSSDLWRGKSTKIWIWIPFIDLMKRKKRMSLNPNPLHRAYKEEKAFEFESESPSSSLWRGKSTKIWTRMTFKDYTKRKKRKIPLRFLFIKLALSRHSSNFIRFNPYSNSSAISLIVNFRP